MNILMTISKFAIPTIFFFVPLYGLIKKVPVYEVFVEGAKEGLKLSLNIFPHLLGMLIAIGIFREAGGLEILANFFAPMLEKINVPAEILPLAILRPLSGSGALALTTDLINTYGANSYIGRLASIMQGSTDTTFYVLTVYFGSVMVKKYRHGLAVGLFADLVSFCAAIFFCNLFFY